MIDMNDASGQQDKRPWLGWYKSTRWQRLRRVQLSKQPLCVMCLDDNETVTAANTVDHIRPHKGDEQLMWDATNLQSLCASCHSMHKQREDRGSIRLGVEDDGWPVWRSGG